MGVIFILRGVAVEKDRWRGLKRDRERVEVMEERRELNESKERIVAEPMSSLSRQKCCNGQEKVLTTWALGRRRL